MDHYTAAKPERKQVRGLRSRPEGLAHTERQPTAYPGHFHGVVLGEEQTLCGLPLGGLDRFQETPWTTDKPRACPQCVGAVSG